jgi:hypothetical protein
MLLEHFNQRCSPPWERRDVERKAREASDKGARPWGYLRDAENGEKGLRNKPSERHPGASMTTKPRGERMANDDQDAASVAEQHQEHSSEATIGRP